MLLVKVFYKLIVLASLFGVPFSMYSQQITIKGAITDEKNEAIQGCILTVSTDNTLDKILAYDTSTINGSFEINLENTSKIDSIYLAVKHFSYESVLIKISAKSSIQNFKLTEKINELNEVIIKKESKLEVKGDTLSYNVEGIKSEKDYTIEDVIKRIPGIIVKENGQITYNEKPISHLYINGVDLLEGRYSIATQGIPANAVKTIDVMKKHHHKRIDIGRTESDQVSLNLKIKDGVDAFFGTLKTEIGVPFLTANADATPIYLKNKFQNIGSLKVNNIGKTLKNVGADLQYDNLNLYALKLEELQIINPPNINGVAISDKFWLDNDSKVITNDALYKVNDSTLVKWNANYVNELSSIESKITTSFLANDATNTNVNMSKNQLRIQRFQTGNNLEINKKNYYLKNNFNIKLIDNSGNENSNLNNVEILSNYNRRDFFLSNNLNFKKALGKNKMIETGLVLDYEQKDENLLVAPPVFEALFNSTSSSAQTRQEIQLNRFNAGAFAEYQFTFAKMEWKVKQNVNYQHFQFNSALQQQPTTEINVFPFTGDFKFNRTVSTTELKSNITFGKTRISWTFASDFINVQANENANSNLQLNKSYFFFQPRFNVKHRFNSTWSAGANYVLNNAISDFRNLYPSLILSSFNTLTQNPFFINKTKTQSVNPYLNYDNILQSFYININAGWERTNSDVTFASELNPNGFITNNVILRPNTFLSYRIGTTIRKSFLGSFSATLNYNFRYTENELFFNNEFLNSRNKSHNIDFEISWDKGTWFAAGYKANAFYSSSLLQINQIDNKALFQTATLDFYTSKVTRISFGTEAATATTSQTEYTDTNVLFNAQFFYKPSSKMFFSAGLLNIFDTDFFTTTNSLANIVNVYQFSLRPRQFTVGWNYSF